MNLDITKKLFLVTGATSGFGKAITEALIKEGAHIIINARGEEKLTALAEQNPHQIETVAGDITTDETISRVTRCIGERALSGMVINAGGPPAMSFQESDLTDWDKAYASVLRWKVKLTQELLPLLKRENYGRIVYIESVSVKQPVTNLVLSNSLRLAVVGFVKTLSQEIASSGVTTNILAPGYHATPAMDRLFEKQSQTKGITKQEARNAFEKEPPVQRMGKAEELASLAVWLLSPSSGYLTGQTISVDGGLVQGAFG
jgi:3-oxoacyl-[acyl-carrier protein] reductase